MEEEEEQERGVCVGGLTEAKMVNKQPGRGLQRPGWCVTEEEEEGGDRSRREGVQVFEN